MGEGDGEERSNRLLFPPTRRSPPPLGDRGPRLTHSSDLPESLTKPGCPGFRQPRPPGVRRLRRTGTLVGRGPKEGRRERVVATRRGHVLGAGEHRTCTRSYLNGVTSRSRPGGVWTRGSSDPLRELRKHKSIEVQYGEPVEDGVLSSIERPKDGGTHEDLPSTKEHVGPSSVP